MTISELRQRSNAFVSDIETYIAMAIEGNDELIRLNQLQMKASKDSKDAPLINKNTGSASLSPAYAAKKGKSTPDLLDTGEFQDSMDLIYNEPSEWYITSFAEHTQHLIAMYGQDIFGIANKRKAQEITTKRLRELYINNVL